MKAAQWFGRRDIRVTDVPTPSPKENEALISIEWCGICGSDLHEYLIGPFAIPTKERLNALTNELPPVTMGHEFCGRIISAPKNSNLKPGQPVMIDPRIYCRSCSRCDISQTHGCRSLAFKGIHGTGGGFSETIAVDATLCHVLPESVDLRFVALIEPLAVAWHAVKISGTNEWDEKAALILGGGPVGIATVMVLRALGCKKIYVSEPTALRAEQNKGISDEIFNPAKENIGERVRELTNSEGVDVVFDCAGVQRALDAGMDALRFRGTYMNVAVWETQCVVPLMLMLAKEITLKASLAYNDKHFKETVDAFVAGKFKGLENMVTSQIHVDDIVEKGFEELVHNKDQHIKIMVTTHKDKL
ncbi:chaperonin 10-like protein [Dendryphion nanum]|uniref:Chaperonin 10-like protein n=1 Tax=Dendryphion nanum TaxID=256645 RepID=A0A9P9IQ56_9PLEO|nr:chaperonin 10-like protein [Dendryphion nanum]